MSSRGGSARRPSRRLIKSNSRQLKRTNSSTVRQDDEPVADERSGIGKAMETVFSPAIGVVDEVGEGVGSLIKGLGRMFADSPSQSEDESEKDLAPIRRITEDEMQRLCTPRGRREPQQGRERGLSINIEAAPGASPAARSPMSPPRSPTLSGGTASRSPSRSPSHSPRASRSPSVSDEESNSMRGKRRESSSVLQQVGNMANNVLDIPTMVIRKSSKAVLDGGMAVVEGVGRTVQSTANLTALVIHSESDSDSTSPYNSLSGPLERQTSYQTVHSTGSFDIAGPKKCVVVGMPGVAHQLCAPLAMAYSENDTTALDSIADSLRRGVSALTRTKTPALERATTVEYSHDFYTVETQLGNAVVEGHVWCAPIENIHRCYIYPGTDVLVLLYDSSEQDFDQSRHWRRRVLEMLSHLPSVTVVLGALVTDRRSSGVMCRNVLEKIGAELAVSAVIEVECNLKSSKKLFNTALEVAKQQDMSFLKDRVECLRRFMAEEAGRLGTPRGIRQPKSKSSTKSPNLKRLSEAGRMDKEEMRMVRSLTSSLGELERQIARHGQ